MDNDFYIFPKWLLEINISSDSKLLYMFLLNMKYSSGNEYIYITAKEIEKYLHFTQFKRKKTLRELYKSHLVERKYRGLNTKTYIYEKEEIK